MHPGARGGAPAQLGDSGRELGQPGLLESLLGRVHAHPLEDSPWRPAA